MAENPSTTNPVLLRCPFCGGGAAVETHHFPTEPSERFVRCRNDDCEVLVETQLFRTEAEAIAAWNRRAGADADLLEALKDVLPILEAVHFTVGLRGSQLERMNRARAALSKATEGR